MNARPVRFTPLACVLLALIVLAIAPARADDPAAHFPEIAQVTADYPDDAQRSAALSLLSDALNRAEPKPVSRDAYSKIFNYQGAANAIMTEHMANGAMQNGQYRAFNAQVDQCLGSTDFRRGVLQKYGVESLAEHPQPRAPGETPVMPTTSGQSQYQQSQVQIQQAQAKQAAVLQKWLATVSPPAPVVQHPIFESNADVFDQMPKLVLFSLLGLPAMVVAAWLVLSRSGVGRKIYSTYPPMPGSLPALPPALQIVKLPNVRYAVCTLSGLVLDVRRQVHRQTIVSSSPGQEVRDQYGGLVSSTPGTTWSHTTTTYETIVYVRMPNGREDSWSIFDSPFDCRPGNIISVLVRPLKTGAGEILMAYNHATGRLERTRELETTLSARGNELGQWAANLAGAAVAWEVQKLFLPSRDERGQLDPGFIVPWLFECLVLVTISFFILTPWVKGRIFKSRDGAFQRRYAPGYLQFFQQGTPLLQETFFRGR
jgi:hypothetical protein